MNEFDEIVSEKEISQIDVFNMQGQKVLSERNIQRVKLGPLSSGIYVPFYLSKARKLILAFVLNDPSLKKVFTKELITV